MKFLLSTLLAAVVVVITNISPTFAKLGSGSSVERRELQGFTEPGDGTCREADAVWGSSSDIQSTISQDEFRAECGPNGSCMGGSPGCCRVSNGAGSDRAPAYVCDTEDLFPFAFCVCNEFTSAAATPPPAIPPTPPPAGPPTTPNPTAPPTVLSDNCQRFNPESPLYLGSPHPYANSASQMQGCFTNADCPSACCLKAMCVCDFPSLSGMDKTCIG